MHDVVSNARGRNLRTVTRTAFALALTLALALSACTANSNPNQPDPQAPDVAEPFVAKGRVTNSLGQPMAGIEVFADNTVYYDMSIYGVTDANGTYRIALGDITPSSWRVGAYVEYDYNGVAVRHALHPENDKVFAGADGAVRNLSWRMTGETPEGGYYGGLAYVYEDLGAGTWIDDFERVELTFEPRAPLLDGTQGQTTVRMLDGVQIADLPVTKYVASARYLAPVGEPEDLLIRVRDTGSFGPSVDADFGDDGYGYLLMELEVRLP